MCSLIKWKKVKKRSRILQRMRTACCISILQMLTLSKATNLTTMEEQVCLPLLLNTELI